jgi:hypothetical protein
MKNINHDLRPLPHEGFASLPQVLHVLGIGKTILGTQNIPPVQVVSILG